MMAEVLTAVTGVSLAAAFGLMGWTARELYRLHARVEGIAGRVTRLEGIHDA